MKYCDKRDRQFTRRYSLLRHIKRFHDVKHKKSIKSGKGNNSMVRNDDRMIKKLKRELSEVTRKFREHDADISDLKDQVSNLTTRVNEFHNEYASLSDGSF